MSKSIRVLIAEDEYLVASVIRDIIETSGNEIAGEARDGREAVEMTAALKPDVVLMDINLPRLDGIEATRQIQERVPTPTVILTAYQSPELVSRAKEAGVGAYLMKPPDAGELMRTIEIARERFADMMALRELNQRLCEEIKARKETERQLETALEDKTRLMQELLHRSKNNMNYITSLISLQYGRIADKQIIQALKKIENCVHSMAQMQRMLYTSGKFSDVDLRSYLGEISDAMFANYSMMSDKVRLQTEIEPVIVPTGKAILCAMIVNELISNAMKHAFPGDRGGEIRIGLHDAGGGEVELTVSDTGIGLPEDFDPANRDSLGLTLVNGFTRQMNGRIEFGNSGGPGSGVVVRFKIP